MELAPLKAFLFALLGTAILSCVPARANVVYQRTTVSATAPLSSEPQGLSGGATFDATNACDALEQFLCSTLVSSDQSPFYQTVSVRAAATLSATDVHLAADADDTDNIDAKNLRTLVQRANPGSDHGDGVTTIIEVALLAMVILAIVFLTIGTFQMLADPACPRCGQRDWSKGVPHWRCRHCGRNHRPADPLVHAYVILFLFRALYGPQRNPEWRHWVAVARQATLPLMARAIDGLQRHRKRLQAALPLPWS